MSINNQIFTKLVHSQALCRPDGSIPPSAMKTKSVVTAEREWFQSFAPQETASYQLKYKQVVAHYENQENPLTQEQSEFLARIHTFSKGLYNPQLSGLIVLFANLFLRTSTFTPPTSSKDEKKKIKESVRDVNIHLLSMLNKIQDLIKSKKQVSFKDLSAERDVVQQFFQSAPVDRVHNIKEFRKQREAWSILENALLNEALFPLLLRPNDELETLCSKDSDIEFFYFSDEKRSLLLGAVQLLELGIESFVQVVRNNSRNLKNVLKTWQNAQEFLSSFQSSSNEILSFAESFSAKLEDLHFEKRLDEISKLAGNARGGDLSALQSLHFAVASLLPAVFDFCGHYNERGPQLLLNQLGKDQRVRAFLGIYYGHIENIFFGLNSFLQHPNAIFNKCIQASLVAVRDDVSSATRCFETISTSFPVTESSFIRPIDFLVQPIILQSLTLVKSGKPLEKISDLRGSLSAFGANILNGVLHFASQGGTRWYEQVVLSLRSLSEEIDQVLDKAGISSPQFREIAAVHREKKRGVPHLYPLLNRPFGSSYELDGVLAGFLRDSLHITSSLIGEVHLVLTSLHEDSSLDPTVEEWREEMEAFVNKLLNLCELPCTKSAEIELLAKELFQLFQRSFPSFPVSFLEEENIPPFALGILELLLSIQHIHLRSFLELGFYVDLKESRSGRAPKNRTSTKRGRRSPNKEPVQPIEVPKTETITLSPKPRKSLLLEAVSSTRAELASLQKKPIFSEGNEKIYRENDRVRSLENLSFHLRNLEELLQPGLSWSPVAHSETLQKEIALAIEAALSYLFAKRGVVDGDGELYAFSKNKKAFTHNLHVMGEMVPNLTLSEEEKEFLKSLSAMLSQASRPDQNRREPRISALFDDPHPTKTGEDVRQGLILIRKFLGVQPSSPIKIPTLFSASPLPQHIEKMENYFDCAIELQENHKRNLHNRIQPMESLFHNMLRERYLNHFLEDLPFHLLRIESLKVHLGDPAFPPSMWNTLLSHLGLLVEKSMKVSSLYLALSSQEDPKRHILFSEIDGRLRCYDHHLTRNLEILKGVVLSIEEREALDSLDTFSEFTRYPAGKKGRLPSLLQRGAFLYSMREGFIDPHFSAKAKEILGPDQNKWGEKSWEELIKIQTDELLPLANTLLSIVEKLLNYATQIRS